MAVLGEQQEKGQGIIVTLVQLIDDALSGQVYAKHSGNFAVTITHGHGKGGDMLATGLDVQIGVGPA